MKKRVYIAGPISRGDLCHNVNQATDAFVDLAKGGLAPFCPQWSVYSKPCRPAGENGVYCTGTAIGNERMSHADWMGVDLPWVAVADALLRLPGESVGADMEVAEARKRNIPVYHSVGEVLLWSKSPA